MKLRLQIIYLITGLTMLSLLSSCGKKQEDAQNGIYYWRTTFDVTQAEQQFLLNNKVKRLYLHLFDVDIAQRNLWEAYQPQPIASIQFLDSENLDAVMEQIDECIPTIFITLDAIKEMQFDSEVYAQKLSQRILNMCSYHGFLDKVHEIQLDCDWTESTEYGYFYLLREMRKLLHEHDIELSATIRLHQLRTELPPVDKGVLMLYNTGSLKHVDTNNSILDYDDAMVYIKDMQYALPLDYAFPTFGWGVWFRENNFQAILHQQNYDDTTLYKPIDATHYSVVESHIVEGHRLLKGDVIRKEAADSQTIEQLKNQLPFAKNTSIILYHLDEHNLSNFSSHEITSLYSRSANH